MLEQEIWRDIDGYEGYYQVSNLGNVRSLTRTIINCDGVVRTLKGKVLRFNTDTKGYYTVHLHRENRGKRMWVHRLVAAAFIQPIQITDIINHLDGIKKNNHVSNLEITTSKGNTQHAIAMGLIKCYGEEAPSAKLSNAQAVEIRKNFLSSNCTYKQFGKRYGVCAQTIWNIVNNKSFVNL